MDFWAELYATRVSRETLLFAGSIVDAMLLTDLPEVARSSGLRVIQLDGWQSNYSNGAFEPEGVLCHHTGAYDAIADPVDDLSYAKWLAFTGRPPNVPPPLCNLALSAESVVYVCCAGNANHAGAAKASGPMPAASDGSALYVGIEAMNSGSQGWNSLGTDMAGKIITQRQGYARLCAALCKGYDWPASHVRAHRETSVTGKWDPGGLAMDPFRADIHLLIEDDMFTDADRGKLDTLLARTDGLRVTLASIEAKLEAIDVELDSLARSTQVAKLREQVREIKALIVATHAS